MQAKRGHRGSENNQDSTNDGKCPISFRCYWLTLNVIHSVKEEIYLNVDCNSGIRTRVLLHCLHAGCQTKNPVKNCKQASVQLMLLMLWEFYNQVDLITFGIFHRGCRVCRESCRSGRTPSPLSPVGARFGTQPPGKRTA